jgi:hypothetical protein
MIIRTAPEQETELWHPSHREVLGASLTGVSGTPSHHALSRVAQPLATTGLRQVCEIRQLARPDLYDMEYVGPAMTTPASSLGCSRESRTAC